MPNPFQTQRERLNQISRQQAEAREVRADLVQQRQQREQTTLPHTGSTQAASSPYQRAWSEESTWERAMQTIQAIQARSYTQYYHNPTALRGITERNPSMIIGDQLTPITPPQTTTPDYEIGDWVEWTLYGVSYKGKIFATTPTTMTVSWDSNFLKNHHIKVHEVSVGNKSIHKIKAPTQKELVQEKINKLWKESNYVKQNKQLIY